MGPNCVGPKKIYPPHISPTLGPGNGILSLGNGITFSIAACSA